MRKTFGIFAHVDGGKTTFSEQLLYHGGVIRKPGRVDQKNTVMDGNEVEKARGITIYADQSWFEYQGDEYYLLDTPGHVDFSAETERAATVLDYAILLVDASFGVAAHTVTLFRMLERFQIPIFIFLNKTDLAHADTGQTMKEIRDRLTRDAVLIENWPCEKTDLEMLTEFVAERDEEIMEDYLEAVPIEKDRLFGALRTLIRERRGVLCMKGSALNDQGISQFFQAFHELTESQYKEEEPFFGLVYKVRHDEKGQRVTFLKVLSGVLKSREEVRVVRMEGQQKTDGADKEETEKIHEIRLYSGKQSQTAGWAPAGSLCAVTGLTIPVCQDLLASLVYKEGEEKEVSAFISQYVGRKEKMQMRPALQAQITSETTDSHTLFCALKTLEEEEPRLFAEMREDKSLVAGVMGKIQLEVLEQTLKDRFGIDAFFASKGAVPGNHSRPGNGIWSL